MISENSINSGMCGSNSDKQFAPFNKRKTKQEKKQASSGLRARVYIDPNLPSNDEIYSSVIPDSEDWHQRKRFLKQVKEAFEKEPTLAGVTQGRREIKLGKRGFRCNLFPSIKNATGSLTTVFLPMESRAETIYALELERNLDVQAYRTQAIEIELPSGTAFPDFLVIDQAGFIHLRDVKADKRHLSEAMKRRIEQLNIVLSRWGVTYDVVDLNEMTQGTKLVNMFWLNQRIRAIPKSQEIESFFSICAQEENYGKLIQLCKENLLDVSTVPYLLFIERLNINWQKLIDDSTKVSL